MSGKRKELDDVKTNETIVNEKITPTNKNIVKKCETTQNENNDISEYTLLSRKIDALTAIVNNQNSPTVKVLKMYDDVITPEYKTEGSSGCDIRAYITPELIAEHELSGIFGFGNKDERSIYLYENRTFAIPTGLKMEIPDGYEIQVRTRSGLACKGIFVMNSPGTVDSDYRGEIKVIIHNASGNSFKITHNDRIAQIVLAKTSKANYIDADIISTTERNENGFGSTGVK